MQPLTALFKAVVTRTDFFVRASDGRLLADRQKNLAQRSRTERAYTFRPIS